MKQDTQDSVIKSVKNEPKADVKKEKLEDQYYDEEYDYYDEEDIDGSAEKIAKRKSNVSRKKTPEITDPQDIIPSKSFKKAKDDPQDGSDFDDNYEDDDDWDVADL